MRFAYMMPLLALLALAACGEAPVPDGPTQSDQQAVTMVEDANAVIPPMVALVPEAIASADIKTHDMTGPSCNYHMATTEGPLIIARPGDAFVKLDGEVIRLAADPGSRALPSDTRTSYNGREFSLRLENAGPLNTISLRDRWDREIYSGTGPVRCGA